MHTCMCMCECECVCLGRGRGYRNPEQISVVSKLYPHIASDETNTYSPCKSMFNKNTNDNDLPVCRTQTSYMYV